MFDEGWDWGGHAALSWAIPANAANLTVSTVVFAKVVGG